MLEQITLRMKRRNPQPKPTSKTRRLKDSMGYAAKIAEKKVINQDTSSVEMGNSNL